MKVEKRQCLRITIVSIIISFYSHLLFAEMTLESNDIKAGEKMSSAQEYAGFGCDGGNVSPSLVWKGAPEETKSFAITVFDPDAPTGSGWWHWVLVNLPTSTSKLDAGAGTLASAKLPTGSQNFNNDYGTKDFGGACPPKGSGVHRYQFKLHALNVEALELPSNASAALVGYYLHTHALETATLEALYQR